MFLGEFTHAIDDKNRVVIPSKFRTFITDAQDRDIALAWRVAALDRYKTLPKLETLLSTGSGSRRQTAAEQRGVLAILSAQYGRPLQQSAPRTPRKERDT